MSNQSPALPKGLEPMDDPPATTLGTRRTRLAGTLRPPTPHERAWVQQMANCRTRVPKGVFRYRTMAEANADWEQWCVDLVAAMVATPPRGWPGPPAEAAAVFTRPATWEDVVHTARLLNREGVEYLLVGGYALAAHGYVRMTEDIDIAVAPDPENTRRWVLALSQLPDQAAHELIGEVDPFAGDHLHAIRINDEFTVDILPSVSGIPFSELARHCEYMTLDGERILVLGLQGLLMTKQGVRPKDQADAAILLRAIERLRSHS
jgi:hypothetical protein